MTKISEVELARIVDGIVEDADSIYKHNPVGTREETLFWMLMSCLVTYLSLSELETPCFTGVPNADTYKEAVRFIVSARQDVKFALDPYLERVASA